MIMLSSIDMPKTANVKKIFAHCLAKPLKHSQLYKIITDIFKSDDRKDSEVKTKKIITTLNNKLSSLLPLKILLAEDNVINQKIALRMLEKLGYSVDLACNGLEVIEYVADNNYNIILMDMQMPKMDGIDAAKYILKKYPEKNFKIIALTANAMAEDKKRCLEAGMNDYLSKPIIIEDLQKALIKWGSIQSSEL